MCVITGLHVDIINFSFLLWCNVVAPHFCRLAKELIVMFTRLVMYLMIKLLL